MWTLWQVLLVSAEGSPFWRQVSSSQGSCPVTCPEEITHFRFWCVGLELDSFRKYVTDHLMWNSQGCVCKKGTKHPRDKQRNGFYQRYHFQQFEPQTSWVNQFWKRLHFPEKVFGCFLWSGGKCFIAPKALQLAVPRGYAQLVRTAGCFRHAHDTDSTICSLPTESSGLEA